MRRRALLPAGLAMLAGCAAETTVLTPVVSSSAAPLAAAASSVASSTTSTSTPDGPPPAPREFRAAWIATVSNIDWPSRPGLPADVQRAEAIALLDRARALGLNALILQVRPAGDAIYPSTLEPWSEYLTGEQGRAPAPNYDPLAFWVSEAHRRGLELHAWFNPYRARHSSAKTPLVAPHIAVRQPTLVKRYADMLWMDPGEPAAAAHTLAVVADVLRRYDIDGVHIDDYFYPYPVAVTPPNPNANPPVPGVDLPFPDDEAWARFQLGGGALARDDWRRSHVDALVQALQRTVHEIKPMARFGVSPFGIGRPELRPAGISGFSQYDKLYANVEAWLENGWLDYLAPQLYWPIAREGQQFPVLLDYWLAAPNPQRRHVWPGLFTSQVPRQWPVRELLDQVAVLRTRPAAGGHIHFSMVALMQERDGLANLLQTGPYAQPALPPVTPWLPAPTLAAPLLKRQGTRVRFDPLGDEPVARWAVWRRAGGTWSFTVLAPAERSIDAASCDAVAVSAVGRANQLSERAIIRFS